MKIRLEMFRKLKDLYQQYKSYIRVDLIMYGTLIVLIMIYFIINAVF